jgi:hypothetical protein
MSAKIEIVNTCLLFVKEKNPIKNAQHVAGRFY